MKKSFLDALGEKILLADGAMGTEIYARNLPHGGCLPRLNLSAPAEVRAIHESYIEAGALLIETNTFGANPISLARYGLEKEAREINLKGAAIARQVSQGRAYVAGSVGPVGRETASSSDIYAALALQIEALTDGRVDIVILETFSDLEESELGCRAARDVTELPLVLQFSFHALQSGTGPLPEEAAKRARDWGVDVVGANCGSGPEQTLETIQRMAKASSIRLSAMPSAGLPRIADGRAVYPVSAQAMAMFAKRLADAGASLIGGCCGTTPAMIRAMNQALQPS
jgi:homocysteine S-methyltransferase